MKKVLFLMFLLFLIGLGTANLKAQVRIGGNTPPDASAVLDLNADGTNSGTKGLALPRVALTSPTMLLSGVTANLTGMLVYNTSTTGGAGVNTIGVYYWNGATWVKASLPSTSAADSGKILIFNGSSWVTTTGIAAGFFTNTQGVIVPITPVSVTWNKVADSTVTLQLRNNMMTKVNIKGVSQGDLCWNTSAAQIITTASNGEIYVVPLVGGSTTSVRFRCYRPSA